MAGDSWWAIIDYLLANVRPKAVGSNEGRTRDPFAGGKPSGHADIVPVIGDHFGVDPQVDPFGIAAGLQKHAMQITPVHHGIGIVEPCSKRLTQVDVGDLLARD